MKISTVQKVTLTAPQGIEIEIPDDYNINGVQNAPKYNLIYRKLNNEINTYEILDINEITARLIRCQVKDKGFRSFRINGVLKFNKV